MGFQLEGGGNHPRATSGRGVPVTDLKWLGLGRSWLPGAGGSLSVDHEALFERLGAQAIYLALGLSRNWEGEFWPLVVGVHVVPDYEAQMEPVSS